MSSSKRAKIVSMSKGKRQSVALALAGSAVLFTAAGAHYFEQSRLAASAEGFDGRRAFDDLRRLVALGPRPPDSPALDQARKYIAEQLGDAGVGVTYDAFAATTPVGQVGMRNIIGKLPGDRPEVVIIAGHYDTARLPGIRFVGANDGGSSAAELIELARVLARRRRSLTYWIVFFDGEEAMDHWSPTDSLYGSRHVVESMQRTGQLHEVRAVLLLDMVAGRDPHFGLESNSTPWLRDLLFSTARRLGYESAFPRRTPLPVEDDHLPFITSGVPAVDLIDFAPFLQGYHHTAQDTLDRCSPNTMEMVGRVVLVMLAELSRRS